MKPLSARIDIRVALLVPLSAWLATGCGDELSTQEARAPEAPDLVATRAALGAGTQCPTRDAVSFQPLGSTPTDTCRLVPGWTVSELVRQGAGVGGSLVPGLYCWYRADSTDGSPDFAALASLAPGAQPDCPLVTPQATLPAAAPNRSSLLSTSTAAPNLTRMPADQLTADMVGAVTPLPAAPGDVHVAVLDTSANPYDSTIADNYLHGRAVARAIARLACADPALRSSRDCALHVENRLAMSYVNQPFESDGRLDTTHGGFYGTRAELADQIRQVLDALEMSPRDRRQIINLSLAWEPEADGMYPDGARVALQRLLERAACLGVLTVSAAGNGRRAGAVLPAGWESRAAPDAAGCAALGFTTRFPFGVGNTRYRPLIYAVGAADATDRPLATSRYGSLPRLLAYGMDVDSGLSFVGSDTPPTYTGTSMATAIASAAAAVVWGWLPASDPHDVMAMVYDSGVDLPGRLGPPMDGRGTELCYGSLICSQIPIHRVSVCGAATAAITAAATAGGGGTAPPACTSIPAHSAIDAPPANAGLPRRTLIGVPTPAVPGSTPSPRSCPAASCLPASAPVVPAIEPWTRPQPERPPCSTCRLTQPNIWDNSLLWGTTWSTLPTVSWHLDLVITPYFYGVAQPDQVVDLDNSADPSGAITLGDWVTTYNLNSASARFEWTTPTGTLLVSQSTAIDVDTP